MNTKVKSHSGLVRQRNQGMLGIIGMMVTILTIAIIAIKYWK
jgi:hypothetical protein